MNFYNHQKLFYCGIDLHAKNIYPVRKTDIKNYLPRHRKNYIIAILSNGVYICIMNKEREILVHRQIRNNSTALFLKILQPYLEIKMESA